MPSSESKKFSSKESGERLEKALRAALSTSPKPRKPSGNKKSKASPKNKK